MSTWLDPVRDVLDGLDRPRTVFVRDDDTGWEHGRLVRLLDLMERYDAPIDLAAIPTATTRQIADELRARRAGGALVGVHQHGFSHTNHQIAGRSCEFGTDRRRRDQHTDIAAGRRRLEDVFADVLDPFFTPPWNRCTRDTAAVLCDLGFTALSRDLTAEPFGIPGLAEPRVGFDWFAKRKGVALTRDELGSHLADRVAAHGTLGLMFHHGVMDDTDFSGVEELVALVSRHQAVEMLSMAQVVDATATIGETA